MTKSKLIKKQNKNLYLFSTAVDNLFIGELLPLAPGDYIKVYLMGLMYAENELPIGSRQMANVLGTGEDIVEKAWVYWEDKGAVKILPSSDGGVRIEFLNIIDNYYSRCMGEEIKPDEYEQEKEGKDSGSLYDEELRALYMELEEATGRPVSTRETGRIAEAVTTYGVKPEVFSYAIKYSSELEKYSIDYMTKVALAWTEENCKSGADVKALLDRRSKRNAMYKAVFNELGFSRVPAPGDREMMAKWFDGMKLSLDVVLAACRKAAGLREPNLKYIDKVLENQMLEAGGIKVNKGKYGTSERALGAVKKSEDSSERTKVSRRVLDDYYAYLRENAERLQEEHAKEAAEKIPGMKELLSSEREAKLGMLSFNFGTSGKERRRLQRDRLKKIEKTKKEMLERYGYPSDYVEIKRKCDICRDTGIDDSGNYCSCVKQRADEAYEWNRERNS